jgi:hypothetical protein
MDALEILKGMHEEAKAGFAKVEAAPPAARATLWGKLGKDLAAHEKMEEQFVYDPAAEQLGAGSEVGKWHEKHETEVKEATELMLDIGKTVPTSDEWLPKVQNLHATLDKHIAEEEGTFWPLLRQQWGDENLKRAGDAVGAAKGALTSGASAEGAMQAGKAAA